MKIAFFNPRLASKGGAEIYLAKIAKILAKKHEATVYTIKYDEKVFPEIKHLVKELRTPYLMNRTEGSKASMIAIINAVRKMGKKIPKNHNIYDVHLFPSNFIKNHKPMVWTAHEPVRGLYDLQDEVISELNPIQKLVARAYFPLLRKWDKKNTERNVKMIIANSNQSNKYIKSLYSKPVTTIYPGVDKKYFKVKKSEENVILSVGRLYSTKRHGLIIEAFRKLSKDYPSLRLEVIGKGPLHGKLKEQARGLNVAFKGEVSEVSLLKAYSRAKAVLYYPVREMYGMVPMEAMATSTPVIAVDEGGYIETVKGGAILTRPDPEVIAKETSKLLKSKSKRKALGIKGKNIAKEHTWERTAKETEKVFKKVLQQS